MAEQEQWATVDLMGHSHTAGRVTWENGLLRVDVPEEDSFRTEYYGMAAIYSLKLVSEEIARAYVVVDHEPVAYNAPIVTRTQFLEMKNEAERHNAALQRQVNELQRRLTSVNALPASTGEDDPDF